MNARFGLLCFTSIAAACLAPAQDELRLKRLTEPPDSLIETFYKFENGKAHIGGEVILNAKLEYERGKGGGWIHFSYDNPTRDQVFPAFDVNLYNPYGIFIAGIRIPNDKVLLKPVMPGKTGGETASFRVYSPDYFLRFAVGDDYPEDLQEIAWMSIKHSNTKIGPPGQTRPQVAADADELPDFKRPAVANEVIADQAIAHAKQLAELLGESWDVGVKGWVITITSKFDVYPVACYNRNEQMPPMSGNAGPEVYERYAKAEKYVFKLTYKKALGEEEFQERYMEMRKLRDRIRLETQHDREFTALIRKMDKIQVPSYRLNYDGFEIYQDESRKIYEWIYPSEANRKVGSARTLIASLLGSLSEQR